MKDFINETNYNFGIKGHLTNVILKAIPLSEKMGKEQELKRCLETLPPESSFNYPSKGLDALLGQVLVKEELQKQKIM